MEARETILKSLAGSARNTDLPPRWPGREVSTGLADQFAGALRAAHGEVYLEDSLDAARARLGELLAQHKVSSAAANREAPLAEIGLQAAFPEVRWRLPPPGGATARERASWRQACAGCDAGLTGADLLLAETGTLVLSSGAGKSRLVSLLPPLHIALVSTARLLPDIFGWAGGITRPLPSNTILISGPSKTGDIEQTLSVGVHGPKKLIAILYQEPV